MRKIHIPIVFHPPTYEEYTAEEIAYEVMSNAFGVCKIDIPEMTDSLDEAVQALELFEIDLANFKKKYRMSYTPDILPNRPISTGMLIITVI